MDSNRSNEVNDKNYNVSYKKIILIFGITFVIILALAILFYININKDTSKVIKGSIKYVGEDYIILTDDKSNDEYIIDMDDMDLDDEVKIGDKLKVEIDKINTNKEPIEAEGRNASIISKAGARELDLDKIISNEDMDKIDKDNVSGDNRDNNNSIDSVTNNSSNDTSSDINNNTGNNNVTSNNEVSNQSNNNVKASDNDVVTYFNSVNSEVDKSSNSRSLTDSAKNGFVTVVDFLFYDKPIKGRYFNELSNSAKLKVLKLGVSIDKKIDSYFPSYKSTLSNKYQNVKSLAISKYLDKTTEICSKNEDTCSEAKKGLGELKNNFSITWSFIKDISGVGLSKLKAWYEVWRTS